MFRPTLRTQRVSYVPSRQYHGHATMARSLSKASFIRVSEHVDSPDAMKSDSYITNTLDLSIKHALASDLLKKCFECQSVNPKHYEELGVMKLIETYRVVGLEKPEVYEAYDRYLAQYKRRLNI